MTDDTFLSQALVQGVLKAMRVKLRGPDPIDQDTMLTIRSVNRTLHMPVERALELALEETNRMMGEPVELKAA